MDDDWDLHAVVRGCAATSSTTASTTTTTTTAAAAAFKDSPSTNSQLFSSFNQNHILSTLPFQDLFQPITQNSINEELHDLYKPFAPKIPESSQRILLSPHRFPISPLSVLQDLSSEQQLTKQLPQTAHKQQLFSIGTGSKPNNPSPRPSKKRKNNLKKVCHVSAENLSSDNWSWRKYGQKPIKGSPYPRGYYKCSTLKGCMARKQVERNRSDPGMFIVTYTADHNHPMPTHRSSLAGNSRPKPEENSPKSDDPKKPSCSSETSPEANFSPAPEKLGSSRDDVAEDEEDDFLVSDMAVDDDFFAGLEDFTGGGECDSGQFPASLRLPWSVDNSTAAATGSR